MTDWSKISGDLRGRIEKIMAGDGVDTKKVDSRAEYNELAKLLSGDGKVTGDAKTFVEGMIADYEEAYMIRPEVKERVLGLIKNGQARKADDGTEVADLKDYLKTNGLTKEEKAWIKSVIKGREVKEAETSKTEEPRGATPEEDKEKPNNSNKGTPNVIPPNNGGIGFPTTPPPNVIPVPVPVPTPVPVVADPDHVDDKDHIDNKGAAQSRQGGKNNVNVNGNNNTVIVNGTDGVKNIVEIPGNDDDKTDQTKKPVDPAQVEALANQIFDAVKGFGTKEKQLNNALAGLTKDNIIEVLNEYNSKHPDMFEAILDDLSGRNFKKVVDKFKKLLATRAQSKNNSIAVVDELLKINKEISTKTPDQDLIVELLNQMAHDIQKREARQ